MVLSMGQAQLDAIIMGEQEPKASLRGAALLAVGRD